MRTIGLIGGTSWISTIDYYRLINKQVNEKLGGLNSAKLLLYSVNFEEFKPPFDKARWERVAASLSDIALKLQTAGAECIIICANTMHKVADIIQSNIDIPIIHVTGATANEIVKHKIKTVGLLGTKFTMEESFFTDKLLQAGIKPIVPNEKEREFIHASIFNELTKDIFLDETRQKYISIINRLKSEGAEGVILGCTEIPMLLKAGDCSIPAFDTILIHASAAVEFALGN
jgi:aspartate racemase